MRRDRANGGGFLRLALGLGAGIVLGWIAAAGCASKPPGLDYSLISQAYQTVERHYVDRAAVRSTPLTYGAIDGMVASLGDTGHSTFLTPEMVVELKNIEKGKLEGIGVEIRSKDGRVVVVAPIDDSPAQRAGLRAGDVILKVSGSDVSQAPLSKVVSLITGAPGTSVTLTILNPRTGRTRVTTIIRASIKLRDVTWFPLPGTPIAHLRIAGFDQGAAKELKSALLEIQSRQLRGIILDLRDNPGGILDQAVAAASLFLKSGNVLLVKNDSGRIDPVPVRHDAIVTNIPMTVLVNVGTASAAEIVAAALKSAHRGVLVGETTFGTGTVLGQFPLADGSALLLAIEEWLTPDGESFWHKGIRPNVVVPLPDQATLLLPSTDRDLTPAELRSSSDQQLLRALDILEAELRKSPGG